LDRHLHINAPSRGPECYESSGPIRDSNRLWEQCRFTQSYRPSYFLMIRQSLQAKISDYAIVGDSRTAALISANGSIDWLCLPRFDSPSVFNRLLDPWQGGHFTIAPTGVFSSHRYYHNSTAELVTEFRTSEGKIRLSDFMPVTSERQKRCRSLPLSAMLRVIEGMEGTVELDILFKPRPDDARFIPHFHRRGSAGYFADLGNRLLHLDTDLELGLGEGSLQARASVSVGQRHIFWLAYSEDAPAVYPRLSQWQEALEETSRFWMTWTQGCKYDGPYRDTVIRSALTLKLLSYAPSGAIVAAPTTSLPEVIGGVRNWDYRYCWLRDASFTADTFFRLGYSDEATAFAQWMMHSTTLTHPELKVLYTVYGELACEERQLSHLTGYLNSQPVRTGNDAQGQYQLDIYGEVLNGFLTYVKAGAPVDREMRRLIVKIGDYVATCWSLPDHGIWEIRPHRRYYVYSKVMCWVALDRAQQILTALHVSKDFSWWVRAQEAIRESVFRYGFSQTQQCFVQRFGAEDLDASALLFAQIGFLDPKDPLFVSTVRVLQEKLSHGELIYRYQAPDSLPGREGAFLVCSFWLVEALFAIGERKEAEALYEGLLRRANDVGLYSEEQDPSTGEFLGNFPLALTHLGHIRAAFAFSHGA
jgi:GH15 family glucan-1,4-alpha-glucosidase